MSDFEIVDNVLVKYTGPDQNIVVPDGVIEIGDNAFKSTLDEFHFNPVRYKVYLPDGIKRIGQGAFNGCRNLSEINVPDSVNRIEKNAFRGTGIETIDLPEGLERIEDNVFCNCGRLKHVTFPSTLKHIGKQVFKNEGDFGSLGSDVPITDIMFPEGLEIIDDEAFRGCKELREIILPASIKKIGNRAFAECINLSKVTVQGFIEDFGEEVYDQCGVVEFSASDSRWLEIIHRNDFVVDEFGTLKKYNGHDEEVVIPEGINTIEANAFGLNNKIKKIILPSSLSLIKGDYQAGAFNGCTEMESIIIPEGVHTIESFAFYGCSKLVEMTLPYKAISDNMFGSSGKTIIFNVIDDEHVTHRAFAVFRKDYWVQTFMYPKKYIFPFNENDYSYYDKVLASGNYDGFVMNENGRIKACLWRLADNSYPIPQDLISGMVDFLTSKATKAVKMAEEDKASEYISTMVNYGVINDDNRKKITNALKKSAVPEIAAMADNLTPSADFKANAAVQEIKEEDELDIKLRKIKATELLLKHGIDKIPDVLLADKSGNADNRIVKYIIAEYLKNNEYDSRISKDADKAAKTLDRDSLNAALRQIYDSLVNDKQSLPFLAPLFRYADGKTITEIYPSLIKSQWKAGRVNSALVLNDSREAMLYADKNGVLEDYARLRGQKADVLRDTVLSEFDLDEKGQKTYDLGETVVKAHLMEDLTLQLYDVKADKVVKSIPKRGVDEEKYAEASKDYDDLKKNIKKVIKNRSDILFKAFLNKTKFQVKDWKNVYLNNPVLKKIGQLIIWQQDKQTFTISGKQCITADGQKYKLTTSEIIVAHPMEMKAKDISEWQEYLKEKGLKQPFIQIWEPVYDKKTIALDRYKGMMIPYYRFLKQEKHGIEVQDYDFHNDIEITLKGCQANIERIDWRRHEIAVDDRFEITSFAFKTYSRQVNHLVAYFDRVTAFERVKQDDMSIMDAVPNFNIEQIMSLITTAQKENAVKVLAALLEYKNKYYTEYSTIDSLTLDL